MTKILIVDDDAHIRETYKPVVKKRSFDLYEALRWNASIESNGKVKIDLSSHRYYDA